MNEVLSTPVSKAPCPIELRVLDPLPAVATTPVLSVSIVTLTEKQKIQKLLDELYDIRMSSKNGDGLGYLMNAQANIQTYLNMFSK